MHPETSWNTCVKLVENAYVSFNNAAKMSSQERWAHIVMMNMAIDAMSKMLLSNHDSVDYSVEHNAKLFLDSNPDDDGSVTIDLDVVKHMADRFMLTAEATHKSVEVLQIHADLE